MDLSGGDWIGVHYYGGWGVLLSGGDEGNLSGRDGTLSWAGNRRTSLIRKDKVYPYQGGIENYLLI